MPQQPIPPKTPAPKPPPPPPPKEVREPVPEREEDTGNDD